MLNGDAMVSFVKSEECHRRSSAGTRLADDREANGDGLSAGLSSECYLEWAVCDRSNQGCELELELEFGRTRLFCLNSNSNSIADPTLNSNSNSNSIADPTLNSSSKSSSSSSSGYINSNIWPEWKIKLWRNIFYKFFRLASLAVEFFLSSRGWT